MYDSARSVLLNPGDPSTVQVRAEVELPMLGCRNACYLTTFHGLTHSDHFLIRIGTLEACPTVRIHSECVTGDVFGSLRCDCGSQLRSTIEEMDRSGAGLIIYLRQEGRGIGLAAKIDAYLLQQRGIDTFQANRKLGFRDDERDYVDAVEMLKVLGVKAIDLLTGNTEKVRSLVNGGIAVRRVIPCDGHLNRHNAAYLRAKAERNAAVLSGTPHAAAETLLA